MKKWLVGLVAVAMVAVSASAQEDLAARKVAAEEMMTVMKVSEAIDQTFATIKQMMPQQMRQMAEQMGGGEVDADAEAHMRKVMDLMAEEFKWDKIKDDFINLYATTFTVEEMQGAIAYFKTPSGQAFIKKQPELTKRSMEFTQRIMGRVMPKIQAMVQEMAKKKATR